MRIPKGLQTAVVVGSVTAALLIASAAAAAAWPVEFGEWLPFEIRIERVHNYSQVGGQSRIESILTPETPKPATATSSVKETVQEAAAQITAVPTKTTAASPTTSPTTVSATPTESPTETPTKLLEATATKAVSSTKVKPSATAKPLKVPSKTSPPKPKANPTKTSKPATATHTTVPGTPTDTPVPPTPSNTPTASNTPTPSNTSDPSITPSVTNTPLPSATPSVTFTPKPPTATPKGPTLTPTVDLSGCVYAAHSSYESELLALINDVRKKNGLHALSMNWNLRLAAREHSADMVCNRQYSHTGSNGSSNYDRIVAYGYSPTWWGENFYVGWQTSPQDAFNWWMNSDPHRKNILNANYIHIGIGHAYYDNRNGYTLVFGSN